jgi:hypothetical protein
MARSDFRVSEASRAVLQPFETLFRRDRRRTELFAFLAAAVDDPNAVTFERDEEGLRFTWLSRLVIVWMVDPIAREIDVVTVIER